MHSFAVLLAAFNGRKWLCEQLDSILSQKFIEVVVFVSVDLSTDGTEDYIDARARVDSRIVVLPHGEYFGGAGPNFFRLICEVDFSGFDYVCYADQDDIWLSNKLARAHEVLQRTGADAYSSNVMAFWPSGRRILIRKAQPLRRWDFLFEAAGPGCTYVMKVKLLKKIQMLLRERWDEVQQVGLHDWFSYAFARANCYHWVIDDYATILYRQHEENQVGVNLGWRASIYRAHKVLTGWGLTQTVLISRLVGFAEDPFMTRWSDGSRLGLLWLALHAGQCRRRMRDRILFALSCAALCIVRRRGMVK